MPRLIEKSARSSTQQSLLTRVERRLMAPCCYTQTIDLHMSDFAETMRHEVAAMVLGGQADKQIDELYKALYGKQILAVPDGALGTAAFAIPITFSTLATGGLAYLLHRLYKRRDMVLRLERPETLYARPIAEEAQAIRDRIRCETAW